MFKYIHITFLFSFFQIAAQVNLIPNPGFELNTGCPTFGGQWQFCSNWNNVNMNPGAGPWGTPDYFHFCGTGNTAPPATFSGTCTTQSGNAMMGLVMYNSPFPQYREYLATPLSCSMQPGTTYTLSFWLSNGTGIKSPYTIKNIGAHFSNGPLTQTGWNLINVIPQCEITTNVISTTWTQFTFTINPTASWNYITLGCFRPDASNNPTLSFANPGGPASVYANYFIDNIDLIAPSVTNSFSISSTVMQSQTCGGTSSATITASNPTLSLTYNWSPGNFNTAAASGLTQGVYTVTASNGNGCTASFATTQFTVTQSTNLAVNLSSPFVCKNATAQLSSTVSGGSSAYSYTWMPGNQNTSTINVSNITANTIYTLFVKDNSGCASTLTTVITVDPISANFNYNLNPCSGSFTINNLSVGATNYNWNFGDNTSASGLQPQHSYSNPGTYSISLITISPAGCNDTITKTISIGSVVSSNFNAQVNLCDTIVNFTNNSAGGVSFLWRFGDGITSTLQNPLTHVYSSSGIYNIWLIVSNASGCKDSVLKTVSIIKHSNANFIISHDPCLKQISTLNTSSYAVTYNWSFGDGGTSTLANTSYSYANTGTYSVTLVINSGLTCSATITKPVQVLNGPITDFDYSVSICNGTVKFNNLSINSIGSLWSFGDNSSSNDDSPLHIYSSPGNYTVSLTSSPYSSCPALKQLQIFVTYTPVIADFDFKNPATTYDANFINLSRNATIYFWDFGDGTSSDVFEPSHAFAQMGNQFVCLVASNILGCVDTTCKKIVIDADWTFYVPNTFTPNEDNLNDVFYAYGTNIKDFKISIFDRWGENIFNSNLIENGWNGTFKGNPVKDDIYVWKADFYDYKNKNHSLTGHIQILR